MKTERFGTIDFPSDIQKERSIAQIVSLGAGKPRKLSYALWEAWRTAGVWGICFGVWDCMLSAMLLNGILWAAVYESVKQYPQILGLLVFMASPLLYAMLHVLSVWKEIMTGTYELLMVCRLTIRQMTVLRMLLSGALSVIISVLLNLWLGCVFHSEITMLRLLSLSMSALFFYACMQIVLESEWKSRQSCWAAPVLWSGFGIILLFLAQQEPDRMIQIPTAVFMAGAAVCAFLYLILLKKYYYESAEYFSF